jgi:hypothetical protein
VKANLARFTVALSLLATIALTLGAGVKWDMLNDWIDLWF